MGAAHKIIDKKILQHLVPFNALSPVHFNEVAQKTVVEEIRAGRVIFKAGESDNQSIYLLEGEINLTAGNEVVGVVASGSDASRHPLAQQQPRQVSARAKSNCTIARVDSSLLDIMLTWDQSSGYEVAEIDDDQDDDWMTRILQSQAFLKLPPSNIQRLLMSVESYPVRAGDRIIEQGSEGDYFYIIKTGRCIVTRKPSANAKEVGLAELADGDAFGEDALVSEAKRNASVTMMTDGVLMRLAKKDFIELLKEPLLNTLNYAAAAALVGKSGELLDVRLPGEFENLHIRDSRNLPLSALRLEAQSLNRGKKYIVCCDTGRRSASAAFVLSQRGFEVYVLDQGFASVPSEALVGNAAGQSVAPPAGPQQSLADAPPKAHPIDEAAATSTQPSPAAQQGVAADTQASAAAQQALNEAAQRLKEAEEELQRVRDAAREQAVELEQNLAEARQETSTAAKEAQRLKLELEQMRRAEEAREAQSDTLDEELNEQRAEVQRLRSELETLSAERTALKAELEQGNESQAEVGETLAAIQARVNELEPLAARAAQQAEQLESLNAALQAASADNQRLSDERAALERQAAEHAQASEQQRQALETTLVEARSRLEQTQRDAEAERLATQEKLQTLQSELEQTRDDQRAGQARIDALQSELEMARQAQSALSTAEQDQSRLQTQLDEARQDLLDAQAASAALQDQLNQAQTRLERQEGALDDQIKQLQQALDAAQDEAAESLRQAREVHDNQRAELESQRDALRRELSEAQDEIASLRETFDQRVAAGSEAEQQLQSLRQEMQAALAEANGRLNSREAEFQQALTELGERHAEQQASAAARIETLEKDLRAAQAAHEQASADQSELRQVRERLETELETVQARLQSHQDDQAALANQHETQMQALRGETEQAQASLHESQQLRLEIEARLTEMTAAKTELETQLNQLQDAHRQALDEARRAVDAQLQDAHAEQIRLLESELEGARSALARAQTERANLDAAHDGTLTDLQSKAAAELQQVQIELDQVRTALQAADAGRQTAEAQLDTARRDAEQRLQDAEQARQTLAAELEQLRAATTADLTAMQKQMESLREELTAARLADKGSPDEELARLRLLLDEAREEAASARADAESWREHALNHDGSTAGQKDSSDEFDAMRVQLADIQSRVDDALRLRSVAEQEAAQLRAQLQQHQSQAKPVGVEAPVAVTPPPLPEGPRRSGIWMGLAAGLLMGMVGAAGGLWYSHQQGIQSNVSTVSDTQVAPPAAAPTATPAQPGPTPKNTTPDLKPEPAAAAVETATPLPMGEVFRDTLSDGSKGPEMIEIRATTYSMGSGLSSLDFDERPKHDVTLGAFAIGKFEVTFDEYDAFARATGRALPDDKGWGRGERPVINVTWDEAVEYTRWLSAQTGKSYRLASESEWEYAAGGAERTLFWWGNSLGEGRANCFNCGSEWDGKTTAPVGSFFSNPLGLYDTAGNVAEWVQDCYNNTYDGAPSDGSPWVARGCARRVVRGGGLNSPATSLRSAKRDQQPTNLRADDLGFRVARDL